MTRTATPRQAVNRTVIALGALLTVSGVLLSGCSAVPSSAGNRQAEGSDADSDALTTLVTGPFVKDTRVCIINNSAQTPTITFTKFDRHDKDGALAPGERTCVEGYFASGWDVAADITYPEGKGNKKIVARNVMLGNAEAYLLEYLPIDDYRNECAQGSPTAIDPEPGVSWDDGVVRYTWAKPADTQFKEWTLTLAGTQDPTTGDPRICPNPYAE